MAKPDFYKEETKGQYNAWYFDEALEGEKECYEGAVNAYYDANRPLWELNPDKSVGAALEDLAAARLVFKRCNTP